VPTRIYAVKDERTHGIYRGQEQELCSVNLTPPAPFGPGGPFVVLATGELHYLEVSFIIRLSVFRFGGPLLTSAEYAFWRGQSDVIQSSPLIISLAVELPGEGGGGSPTAPPQPRAALAVEAIDGSGYGTASNLTIAAMQFDELHQAATIPAPPMPLDSAAELFLRMRGPRTRDDLASG
jgi:hypothetical protein